MNLEISKETPKARVPGSAKKTRRVLPAKKAAPAKAKVAKAAPAKAKVAKAPTAIRYAGKTLRPGKTPNEARPGTWRHFLIETGQKSATVEAAQSKVDASKEFKGRKMDFGWLVAEGYVVVA